MAKAGTIDGYFKVGNNYDYSGQIINIGTETITSFDLTVNNNGTETTTNYTGLSIAQGDIFDYTISQLKSESMGNRTISATISNVNGTTDSDPSDNRFESPCSSIQRIWRNANCSRYLQDRLAPTAPQDISLSTRT